MLARAVETSVHKTRHWAWWQFAIPVVLLLTVGITLFILSAQSQAPHAVTAYAPSVQRTVTVEAKPTQSTNTLAVIAAASGVVSSLAAVGGVVVAFMALRRKP